MRDFSFDSLPGRVVFGAGSLYRVPAELETLEAERVMLIAGNSAKKVADVLAERLEGRVVARITEVRAHVPREDAEEARRIAAGSNADAVVAVGGGSAIGLGKAVVLKVPLRLVAIPTTYSGSEMTPIYGMTESGIKRTGRNPRVKPSLVIYDPALTSSLPAAITAGSGMNALAHCVEALYAQNRNPITSLMALEGIRAIKKGLEDVALDSGGIEGRSELLYGAYLAGFALGAVGMAIHHKICHVLGGSFGLAHGDANAVVLPHAVACNREAEPETMRAVADALEVDEAAVGLYDLAAAMGAPTSLAQLGMTPADLERATDLVVEDAGYNPRPVEREWVRGLLEGAYIGNRPRPHG
jgi:alcohol dehydrogenase class IV